MRIRAVATITAALIVFTACGSDTTSSAPETKATTSTAATTTTADEMADMDHSAGAHDAKNDDAKADDGGLGMLSNGHHEDMVYTKLSTADQAGVDKLLALSSGMAKEYPTLADAVKAGFKRAGPYSPGIGAHYTAPWAAQGLNPDGVMDEADMTHPMIVIFDGAEATAKFAGFMYYSAAEKQPEGLPGDNDFWHFHTNVCLTFDKDGTGAPFGADKSVTKAMCDSVGGALMEKTQWMVHVWNIPGYEVDEADGGVFAEANPKLKCPDGTYYVMDDEDMKDHPLNVCKSELS